MAALLPDKRRSIKTSPHLKYLLNSFSKVVDNIDKHRGADRLMTEIDLYTMDDDLWEIEDEVKNMEYEAYWDKVGELKDGDWPRYPVLRRFANALGTVFYSNSETERAFSVEGDIHKNPKKPHGPRHVGLSHASEVRGQEQGEQAGLFQMHPEGLHSSKSLPL